MGIRVSEAELDNEATGVESLHFKRMAMAQCIRQLIQSAVREGWVHSHAHGEGEWVIPFWRSRELLFLRGVGMVSLARFGELERVLLLDQGSGRLRELEQIDDLLALLAAEAGCTLADPRWHALGQELHNGIDNNTLCLAHRHEWNTKLSNSARVQGRDNFWLFARGGAIARDVSLFFEQWGAVGHPYHPCSKTKLGMSRAQVLEYAPEFEGGAAVRLVALARTHIRVQQGAELVSTSEPLLARHFPHWLSQWRSAMESQGLNVADYAPVPVHPWQLAQEIVPRFASLIASGHLTLLDGPELAMGATLSFRTLAPLLDSLSPHIKLPVAVQATSAVRTVSPASVHMGARLSLILEEICRREVQIDRVLTVLPEILGLHVQHPSVPADDRRFLSALLRANPNSRLREGETALPVASLFVPSPLSDRPLLTEILCAAGAQSQSAIMDYFEDYVARLLQGHLDLYLLYGVALEAHQQNTLVVFDANSRVRGMLARDFGGVCIHGPTLASRGFDLEAYPGASSISDDDAEVRNKFIHALLQSHIGDWVLCLHREYGLSEAELWARVAAQLMQRFRLLADRLPAARREAEYRALLQSPWQLKALLQMRLKDDAHRYLYAELENPLSHALY